MAAGVPLPTALSLSSLFLLGDDMARSLHRIQCACASATPLPLPTPSVVPGPEGVEEPPHLSRAMQRTLSSFGVFGRLSGPGVGGTRAGDPQLHRQPPRASSDASLPVYIGGDADHAAVTGGGGGASGGGGFGRAGEARPLQHDPAAAYNVVPFRGGVASGGGDGGQPTSDWSTQAAGSARAGGWEDGGVGVGGGRVEGASRPARDPRPPVSWTVPFPIRWRPKTPSGGGPPALRSRAEDATLDSGDGAPRFAGLCMRNRCV